MKSAPLLLWLACAAAMQAAVSTAKLRTELAPWNEAERKAVTSGQVVPGWDLLGSEPGEKVPGPTDAEPPTATELLGDSARSKEVPERFLEPYFGAKPQSFLVDPQGLLEPRIEKDRESFLRYHADDSKIDLYVYLFGANQEIPGSVRSEEIAERFFSEGKPAVVVYYFLGAPERSEIRVTPVLGDSVSGAEQRRALATSLAQALEKQDPVAQLEAFCVQMSIRLYWMEKAAGLVSRPPEAALIFETRPRSAAEGGHGELKAQIMGAVDHWKASAGVSLASLMLVGGGAWLFQSRRKYRFPEFDVPARLGGPHGAGIGAVISFGSSAQSPSTQRNDVPDYLGGL